MAAGTRPTVSRSSNIALWSYLNCSNSIDPRENEFRLGDYPKKTKAETREERSNVINPWPHVVGMSSSASPAIGNPRKKTHNCLRCRLKCFRRTSFIIRSGNVWIIWLKSRTEARTPSQFMRSVIARGHSHQILSTGFSLVYSGGKSHALCYDGAQRWLQEQRVGVSLNYNPVKQNGRGRRRGQYPDYCWLPPPNTKWEQVKFFGV